ncbi:MAG: DNA alkylation repair protein [Ilumatobacter sp.]|uniref:DNA alkylation repair protein n=1 Tax=Ilumatobacter sp. TaxID=1967498 RepID=UPI002606C32B|nr:DNA alkylation repair protein [Ilumatobacter sp.]MDJ0768230.1 DNA alkylation repair protein [Ilumatobacter sp.]
MAEPLKDSFGTDVPVRIADALATVVEDFDREGFLAACLDGYDDLELTPRAKQIASAMAAYLPADRELAMRTIVRTLGDELYGSELTGMEPFVYLPHVYFIAEYGLDHFETAMTAQYELTKRFTAEFSIRAYLERYPEATLARLGEWANDESVHVRRLVSEGTRPRLPWAPRLRAFIADPSPVIELLERLKDDPEEYVRRSVANNLNDIAKDHPGVVVDVARRWWREPGAGDERRKLVRHALRTLIKQGDPAALDVLGYGESSPVEVGAVTITPERPAIGGKVAVEIELRNPTDEFAGALVDLRVHFVKANGSTSPKVFKGAEVEIEPGSASAVRKTISVAQQSTRTHHPGTHAVEAIVNGRTVPLGEFDLVG